MEDTRTVQRKSLETTHGGSSARNACVFGSQVRLTAEGSEGRARGTGLSDRRTNDGGDGCRAKPGALTNDYY